VDISELTKHMHDFVAAKGWYQEGSPRPQTGRNMAISISLEAAELLELFQWSEEPDRARLGEELADIMLYSLQLASIHKIDLEQSILAKLRDNYNREW
jgi:NTP pyrophosphatase (non-canonical NTP hydrolase)